MDYGQILQNCGVILAAGGIVVVLAKDAFEVEAAGDKDAPRTEHVYPGPTGDALRWFIRLTSRSAAFYAIILTVMLFLHLVLKDTFKPEALPKVENFIEISSEFVSLAVLCTSLTAIGLATAIRGSESVRLRSRR